MGIRQNDYVKVSIDGKETYGQVIGILFDDHGEIRYRLKEPLTGVEREAYAEDTILVGRKPPVSGGKYGIGDLVKMKKSGNLYIVSDWQKGEYFLTDPLLDEELYTADEAELTPATAMIRANKLGVMSISAWRNGKYRCGYSYPVEEESAWGELLPAIKDKMESMMD